MLLVDRQVLRVDRQMNGQMSTTSRQASNTNG